MLSSAIKLSFKAVVILFRVLTVQWNFKRSERKSSAMAIQNKHADAIPAQTAGILPSHAHMAQKADFEVADQIINMKLDPYVGSIHMRIYRPSNNVRTDLIIAEPKLRAILGGQRRHELKELRITDTGLEPVKDEVVRLAEKLINELGNTRVKAMKPERVKPAEVRKPEAKQEVRQPAKVEVAQPQSKPIEVPTGPAKPTKQAIAANNRAKGEVYKASNAPPTTYEGTLMSAEHRMIHPAGRPPYEVFEAKIMTFDGMEVPMRGAELERELQRQGVQIGSRLSVTPMGKVPVDLPNGKSGAKNIFRVENLEGNSQ